MIHVCEHHDEVLAQWRAADRRDLRLAHVDFHDDLRGLLVDRRRGVAYPIRGLARDLRAGTAVADAGDFLAHAVLEGRVAAVRWVHGTPGGRGWDTGIVRYERDLLALPDRLRHRRSGGAEHPLAFEEVALDAWTGLRPGEVLSVDWDCFASVLQDPSGIAARVAAFEARLGTTVPDDTWLAWSPEYCHDSFDAFRALAERLAERFGQAIAWSRPGLERGATTPTGVDATLPRGIVMRTVLWLRRHGIT